MSQNHYQVLGVPATASVREIKLAYKRLAVQYHPDKHGGNTRFEEQFKAVSIAYRVLGDSARRAAYDHQLQLAVRRQEEARRQQQYRPQAQHVYGVPMPPAQPVRTRRPASSAERHYKPMARRRIRFTRRDYLLMAGFILSLLLFVAAVKTTMDHVSAGNNYERGVQAYAGRRYSAAHAFFTEALRYKPAHTAARRRRAEIEQLFDKNLPAAYADYQAVLQETKDRGQAAWLLYRMGQCQAEARPDSAERTFTRALALDSTLSGAWLARGELRLLTLQQLEPAAADLAAGLRLRATANQPVPMRYLMYRGLAYYKLRNFAAARQDYQQVLAASPGSGLIHFLLGRLAQQEGDAAGACGLFERAVQLGYYYADQARNESCRQ
ncbi:DnaJ domain-containing protein [Hymenobacter sp. BT175]|uniref:J domain-containing protein n=1 Tax=Hymenobacter translucens TaxID=2886507 RepID=UPI001D0E32DF|nr:J domain-containing protein [Hymenobacter translucens]MCC2545789.1 DnaJ domain-containing protein [Hymenobacter translucens]